jgi:transposase
MQPARQKPVHRREAYHGNQLCHHHGDESHPSRCWVVERTDAWLNRNRRLAKDFEKTIASATAWLIAASIQMITRRIASA